MKMNFRKIASLAAVAVTSVLVVSCGADPDSAGLEYMPDMYRSAAIEPYVDYGEIRGKENKEVKTRLSAMVPPSGTVPYYGTDSAEVSIMLPYKRLPMEMFKTTHGLYGYEYSKEDEYTLAAGDVNPLVITEDNREDVFATGKELYTTKCAHCHGKKGDGNGPMVESGAYTGAAVLTGLEIGDGQMFYSIYYGKGMMGSHASILNKKEIWTLVHYINKLKDLDYDGGSQTAVVEEIDNVEQ